MTKKELTEVQKERIGEVVNRYCHGTGFTLYDVYHTIESIINQQTASLYTKEEVQKIVENVREACFEAIAKNYPTINYIDIHSLDLNQFIKK